MSCPKFQPGQKAKHLGAHVKRNNRAVTVLECINEDDPVDVHGGWLVDQRTGKRFFNPGQGYRYYVSYKGLVWSVPEGALRDK